MTRDGGRRGARHRRRPETPLEDGNDTRFIGGGHTVANLMALALVKWLVVVAIGLGAALATLAD